MAKSMVERSTRAAAAFSAIVAGSAALYNVVQVPAAKMAAGYATGTAGVLLAVFGVIAAATFTWRRPRLVVRGPQATREAFYEKIRAKYVWIERIPSDDHDVYPIVPGGQQFMYNLVQGVREDDKLGAFQQLEFAAE